MASIRDELRAQARERRASLPDDARVSKSTAICEALCDELRDVLASGPSSACVAAVYSSLPGEVDLSRFIEFAYDQGCQVVFPCMVRDAWGVADAPRSSGAVIEVAPRRFVPPVHATVQTMEMRVVPRERYRAGGVPFLDNPLRRFSHGDAELASFPYKAATELAMMVVPVVGFDAQGNRLGYGKGNYDRYLAQVPASVRVVGAAFAEQQVEGVPIEEHDIPIRVVFA